MKEAKLKRLQTHDYNYDVLKRGNYINKKMSVLAGGSKEGRQGRMDEPQVREDGRGQAQPLKE